MSILDKRIDQLTPDDVIAISMVNPDFFWNMDMLRKAQKNIGASGGISTKAMSAEEFKEEEHPRANDGKFTDKPGGAGAAREPDFDKGAHGGMRKNAGRTPKDPVAADQKLRQRFQEEAPGASEEEINKKITDYALEKNNMDLYLYKTDPVEFQKRRDQERMDAMLSKGTKQKVGGKDVERIDDSSGTTAVRSDLKTSEAAWKRMVQQSKDLEEAYKTFKDSGQADEADKSKAKLVTAAATIAAVVGLGVLYAKRPNAIKLAASGIDGGKNPTWIRWFKTQGIDPDLGEAAEYLKFQEGIIADRHVGAIRNLMGKVAAKLGKVDKETGETLYPFLGPKAAGFGTGSHYRPRRFEIIKIRPGDSYTPAPGDIDAATGMVLVKQGAIKKIEVDHIALAVGRKRIPLDPNQWGTGEWANYRRGNPPGLRVANPGTKEAKWEFTPDPASAKPNETSTRKLENWLKRRDEKSPSPQQILDPRTGNVLKGQWPSRIRRERPEDAFKKDMAAAEEYRGYLHYFDFNVLPMLSGRVLAMLTAAAGTTGVGGTAYYFQGDVENWLSSYAKHRQESEEASVRIQSPRTKGDRNAELKLQLQIEKQREKSEKAAEKAAYQKSVLTRDRNQFTEALTRMGLRNHVEGSVPTWAHSSKTLLRRFDDAGIFDNSETSRKAYEVMFGDDLALQKEFLNEVDNMELKPAARKRWKEYEEKHQKKSTSQSTSESTQRAQAGAARAHREAKQKTTKGVGISGLGLIMKAFEPEPEPEQPKEANEDDLITAVAMELAQMISDISQSCKMAVRSGMPGNTGFAELNDIVNEIVGFMKDASKKSPEKMETKGMDMPVMSTQSDMGGGLFAEPRRCSICGKTITKEIIQRCKHGDCPTRFWEKITSKAER